MPVDKFKTSGPGEVLFVLHDPDQVYTHSEVVDLLDRAESLGFSLDTGGELDGISVHDLDVLVNRKQ